MKKINIKIKGMHCKSCEMLIKDELEELGAKEIGIDYKTGKVSLTFDESKLKLDTIKTAIKKLRYEVI
jgi:copper chaperone